MPVRPAPDARSLRADALLAGVLALVGCLMVALTAMTGMQFADVPIWQPMLAAVVLAAPLMLRRVQPVAASIAQVVIYIVAGELGVIEIYVSQVALFMGFYSIGAWDANRTRALWTRVSIVVVMAAWLASSAVRGFFDPETGERGVSAFFALLMIQIVINIAYFGGAWIFGDRAWASALEQERLAAAHAEIEAQQSQLAEQAVSLERVRIARELHDVVAHHVSAMGVQAGAARRVLTTDADKAADALRHVEQSARDAIGELRSLVVTLRSDEDATASAPDLDALPPLVAAAQAAGQRVTLTEIGTPRPVTPMAGLTAYRVVQEALTNARKHAGPMAQVDVRVRYLVDELEVEVADDGHGSGAGEHGAGAGLLGMRERVSALGGELELGPRSRGGWLVRARVPSAAARPSD
ncbi:Signal transduction histidine kinase [Agrococcus baldri]|uniref:histidine kinase n=1 Tax=Agrococcus baldri TaxID=153730 RepID=A0AA94HLX0_9MICO|nr:sensor histidine kinase [Agrococcus baldri]SFS08856.1 Signal transduction histidine kinase [Agrococcus baldri]